MSDIPVVETDVVVGGAGITGIAAALLLCGLLAGCGGDDEPSAEETAVREATEQLLTQVHDAQYVEAWTSLHPAYQAVIPQEQLVDCGERFPPVFESFEIDDMQTGEYAADEIGKVDAWLVDVTFETTDEFKAASGSSSSINRPFHFIQAGDAWHWFPGTGELDVFKDGNCGLPWPGGSS